MSFKILLKLLSLFIIANEVSVSWCLLLDVNLRDFKTRKAFPVGKIDGTGAPLIFKKS